MDFRIRQLRCFLTLAELLNFGKTARALYMSQTTTTFQIKSLEDAMGVTLFERDRQRVRLTAAGAAFRPFAQRIVDAVAEASSRLDEVQNPLTLRVACGRAGHAAMLPSVLRALTMRSPALRLRVSEMTTEQQIAALTERRLDAALMVPRLPVPGVRFEPLRVEPLYLMLPAGHPLAASTGISVDVLRHMAVLTTRLEECRMHRPFLRGLLAPFGIQPRLVESPQSSRVQFAYVAAGEAVALMPASMAANATPDVVAVPFREALPQIELGLATMATDRTETLRAFRELVLECASVLSAEDQTELSAA